MTADRTRSERRVTLCNLRGLHARASARFVKRAESFRAEITVEKDGLAVPGTSIMGLMLLAAARGDELLLRAEGEDAAEAVAALSALVAAGFDEPD
ncbi:MAG: HPr family phosphocarrier protein [Rhodothalassiaceae bacterium]